MDADRVADGFKTHGCQTKQHHERVLASDKGPSIPIVADERKGVSHPGVGPGVEGIGPTEPIDHIESFAYLSFAVSRLFGIAADARR